MDNLVLRGRTVIDSPGAVRGSADDAIDDDRSVEEEEVGSVEGHGPRVIQTIDGQVLRIRPNLISGMPYPPVRPREAV